MSGKIIELFPRAKKRPKNFLRLALVRSKWLLTEPQRFPELYAKFAHPGQETFGFARRRYPSKALREHLYQLMRFSLYRMDIPSRRIGTPKPDGSVHGISIYDYASRTGLGRPPRKRTHGRNWPGRKKIARNMRRLERAGYLHWRDAEQIEKGRAGNPRSEGKKKDKRTGTLVGTGKWRSFPSVRQVTELFLERLLLLERWREEAADPKNAFKVDIEARRKRDREIKYAQRQALAAKRSKGR